MNFILKTLRDYSLGYLMVMLLAGLLLFVLALLYTFLNVIVKNLLGEAFITPFSTLIEYMFRITLFITLLPVGLVVFMASVFINPVGQIIYSLVNIGLEGLNSLSISNGSGGTLKFFAFTKLTWIEVTTTNWITDYSNFLTAIKNLLIPPPAPKGITY